METGRSRTRISESDPLYRESRERAKEESKKDIIFGAGTLRGIEELRGRINSQYTIEDFTNDRIDGLNEARNILLFFLEKSQKSIDLILSIFERPGSNTQSFENSLPDFTDYFTHKQQLSFAIQKAIEEQRYDDIADLNTQLLALKEETRRQVSSFFSEITPDLFEEILRNHSIVCQEKAAVFDREVGGMTHRFRERALHAINEGYLTLTPDELEQRIQETTVKFCDPLLFDLDEKHASYQISPALVNIHANVPREDWEHDFTHEMVHVVGGRAATVGPEREFEDDTMEQIEHQKAGLRFMGWQRRGDEQGGTFERKELFSWLDEGLTEEITLHLLGQEDSNFYARERVLVEFFCNQTSTDPQTVRTAYCESYTTKKKKGELGLPITRSIVGKIKSFEKTELFHAISSY